MTTHVVCVVSALADDNHSHVSFLIPRTKFVSEVESRIIAEQFLVIMKCFRRSAWVLTALFSVRILCGGLPVMCIPIRYRYTHWYNDSKFTISITNTEQVVVRNYTDETFSAGSAEDLRFLVIVESTRFVFTAWLMFFLYCSEPKNGGEGEGQTK